MTVEQCFAQARVNPEQFEPLLVAALERLPLKALVTGLDFQDPKAELASLVRAWVLSALSARLTADPKNVVEVRDLLSSPALVSPQARQALFPMLARTEEGTKHLRRLLNEGGDSPQKLTAALALAGGAALPSEEQQRLTAYLWEQYRRMRERPDPAQAMGLLRRLEQRPDFPTPLVPLIDQSLEQRRPLSADELMAVANAAQQDASKSELVLTSFLRWVGKTTPQPAPMRAAFYWAASTSVPDVIKRFAGRDKLRDLAVADLTTPGAPLDTGNHAWGVLDRLDALQPDSRVRDLFQKLAVDERSPFQPHALSWCLREKKLSPKVTAAVNRAIAMENLPLLQRVLEEASALLKEPGPRGEVAQRWARAFLAHTPPASQERAWLALVERVGTQLEDAWGRKWGYQNPNPTVGMCGNDLLATAARYHLLELLGGPAADRARQERAKQTELAEKEAARDHLARQERLTAARAAFLAQTKGR